MNNFSNFNNFLFISKNDDYVKILCKFCLEFVQTGKLVLIFSTHQYKLLPLVREMQVDKQALQRLVIMYYTGIADVKAKLLDLFNWVLVPNLIVIIGDLNALHSVECNPQIEDFVQENTPPKSFLQSLCSCIATLITYQSMLENRSSSSSEANSSTYSILALPEHEELLPRVQLDLLINLYFYNKSAFDDISEMLRNIIS